MFGALLLRTRKEMHLLAERRLFGEVVIDLYTATRPHLAVMDGVVGMEDNGPLHGTPIHTGVILASYDSVSLDIVASGWSGFIQRQFRRPRRHLKRDFGPENGSCGNAVEVEKSHVSRDTEKCLMIKDNCQLRAGISHFCAASLYRTGTEGAGP